MKKSITAMSVVGLVLQANDALAERLSGNDETGSAVTGRSGDEWADANRFDIDRIARKTDVRGGGGMYSHYVFATEASGGPVFEDWAAASGLGLVGIDAADAICQLEASGAGLPNAGSYIAWISDNQNDAYCRAHGRFGKREFDCGTSGALPDFAGPWLRLDGELFGGSLRQMLDSNAVYRPVSFGSSGGLVDLPDRSWTGTGPTGAATLDNCIDWSTTSSGTPGDLFRAHTGDIDGSAVDWTLDRLDSCATAQRLTCLSVGTSGAGAVPPPPPPFTTSDRRIFVSSEFGPPDFQDWRTAPSMEAGSSGIAGADAICQTLAGEAGLERPELYKALLSTDSTSIFDRLAWDGPWYRIDHVRIADSVGDLFDGRIQASVQLDESGALASGAVESVWTGMDEFGGTALNCLDWTSTAIGASALRGDLSQTDFRWLFSTIESCLSPARVYCIADSDELTVGDFEAGLGYYD